MNKSIFKPILAGILIGALFFLMPFFILNILFTMLIVGMIFRFFFWMRFGSRRQYYKLAMADNIRSMSEEEYRNFRNGMYYGGGNPNRNSEKYQNPNIPVS